MGNWKIVVSGSVKDLATDYGFTVQSALGAGMAAIENISSDYGLLDGALFQRQRADIKTFTLVGTLKGTSVSNLHGKRRALIDAIKPDRTAAQEAVVLQYTGSGSTLQASAFYDGGLELGQTMALLEPEIALRFVQFDPFWELSTSCTILIRNSQAASPGGVLRKTGFNSWQQMGSSFNDAVKTIHISSSGNIYAGGNFTSVGGSTVNHIAKWNGTNWTPMSTGLGTSTGQHVGKILEAPDGTVYAAGNFVTGVPACYLAKWNGSTWAAVSSSATNDEVKDLVWGPDNNLYLSGFFTAFGSTSACRIAKWNGTTWSSVGTGASGTTRSIYTMAFDKNGILYVGGEFDAIGGVTACSIAKWNGTAWSNVGSGSGANRSDGTATITQKLLLNKNGNIVAAGGFNQINGKSFPNGLAEWNGTAWSGFQSGSSDNGPLTIAYLNNILYIGGFFTTMGDLPLYLTRATRYNGTTWLKFDISGQTQSFYPSGEIVSDASTIYMTTHKSGDIDIFQSSCVVVNNPGTAITYPVFTTSGTGSLVTLSNATTNQSVEFNRLSTACGETVTVDFRPNKKTVNSSIAGNIVNSVIPNSNISTFHLLPGNNTITLFMPPVYPSYSSSNASSIITFTPRFWSLDGNA